MDVIAKKLVRVEALNTFNAIIIRRKMLISKFNLWL
jgi:hypothetical protein